MPENTMLLMCRQTSIRCTHCISFRRIKASEVKEERAVAVWIFFFFFFGWNRIEKPRLSMCVSLVRFRKCNAAAPYYICIHFSLITHTSNAWHYVAHTRTHTDSKHAMHSKVNTQQHLKYQRCFSVSEPECNDVLFSTNVHLYDSFDCIQK